MIVDNRYKLGRGRPKGLQPYSIMSNLNSVARIAVKYNLDPRFLLDAFTEAWVNGESKYENLEVQCRRIDHDLATFILLHKDKIIWQFPVQVEILQKPEFFKSYIPSAPIRIQKEDNLPKSISELKAKMRGITLRAKIIEIPPSQVVNTKYGYEAYVSNVLIADKTGTIRLGLWNNQITSVSKGDTINIEKGTVITFRGQLQLKIGRGGKMKVDTSAGGVARR